MAKNAIKLIVISAVFLLFSVLMALQSVSFGYGSFFVSFFVTFLFSLFIFLFQVQYYVFAVKSFLKNEEAKREDFVHPLDIWLVIIPMGVLCAIAYVFLNWAVVEVFYCTGVALTGMLFGNNLGRGEKRWSAKKSLPFFFGVIMSTAFAFIAEALMG
jgi:hypothetical protein